jgi:hypothetical protein
MVSRKKYLVRLIGTSIIFFVLVAVIFAFFFSMGRGHALNFDDATPWLVGALVSGLLTVIWVKRKAKYFRERENLWGPPTK